MTREEKKAETRQQLLDAAYRVFSTKGFFAASLDDVAAEAGFSKGAVYSNFESKEDLFFSLIEQHTDEQAAKLKAAVEPDASFGEQAREAGDQFVAEFWGDELGPSDLEFRVCLARNPELRERAIPRVRAMRSAIAKLIEDGASERGMRLSMSPERLATLITAVTNGLALERLQDPESVPDDMYGQVLAMVFNAAEVKDH